MDETFRDKLLLTIRRRAAKLAFHPYYIPVEFDMVARQIAPSLTARPHKSFLEETNLPCRHLAQAVEITLKAPISQPIFVL
jgi:hypothetical protein